MLKIEKGRNRLLPLGRSTVGALTERYDLGQLIVNSADEFFGEIGQRLFVVGKNVCPSEAVPIPIDLLALDPRGQAVIVVLQRGKEQSPFARAITCAGMIAAWEPDRFLNLLPKQQAAELRSFLAVDISEINRNQRAILVAESFDFEVLAASQWLKERYQMENDCVRVSLALDPVGDGEYLNTSTLSAGGVPAPAEREARGNAKAVVPDPASAERRKQLRTEKSRSEHLRLEYHGKLLAAKLVDASDGGLGAEMYVELQPGAAVAFAGELHSPFFCMKLHGRARVAYCRTREEGVYRVGLAFEDVNVRKLDCAHETGEPIPAATRRPVLTQPSENGGA
jgi:hypothetical protein